MSGADLANVINEAALLTAREHGTLITNAALEESVDRVVGGPRRKSKIISEQEKKITAYHEGGHALAAWAMPDLEPVYKLTILPRGRTGGHALVVPEDDKGLMTRSEMIGRLVFAMGGRSAEELVFHEPTTGASSDIDQATKIARAMVTEYGMSARLGAVRYGREQGDPFLGRSMGNQPDYSLEVAHEIDEEVRALIEAAHTEAWEILNTYRDVLDDLVFELLREGDADPHRPGADLRPGGEAAADHRVQRLRRAHPVGQAADPDPGRAGPRARRAVAAADRAGPRAHPGRLLSRAARTASRSRARAQRRPAAHARPARWRLPRASRRTRRPATRPGTCRSAAPGSAGRWPAAAVGQARQGPGGQPNSVPHNYGAPPDWRPATTPPGSPGRRPTRASGRHASMARRRPSTRPQHPAARHPARRHRPRRPGRPTGSRRPGSASAGSSGTGEHAAPDGRATTDGPRGGVTAAERASAAGTAGSRDGRRRRRPGRGPRPRCGSC